MTIDDLSKHLMRGLSNLRADVRENVILVEQMRDELRAVHEAEGGIEQHLPERLWLAYLVACNERERGTVSAASAIGSSCSPGGGTS